MAVDENKLFGFRVNYFIIFLTGLVLLTVGVLIFLVIIQNVYGRYEVSEILPTKKNLELINQKNKVGLLYSKYTENMLPEGSTWLSDNIDTWEVFLKNAKINYDVISDQTIELGKHYKYKAIILPSAKSMSDKELIELKKYLEKGGSVFATMGPGTFSDEGKWRGWSFFTEAFGMKFNREIKPEETYKVHTLRGNLILTAGIPTGYTLKIATWDRPIYAEILEPRVTQVSFWYDFRREAGLVREEISKSAGIANGTYGKGRFVWYGFELNSVIGKQEDYINFEKLFRNSVAWLLHEPVAFVKDWPAPYNAAAVFIPEISEQPQNIYNLLKVLKNKHYPATFFIDPYTAIKNPKLIKDVAKYGDLGVVVDIGYKESAEDTVNQLDDKLVQLASMRFAKDTVEALSGGRVRSLMPLYGFYDENTLQAVAKTGMEFIVTDSLTDRSVPKQIIRFNKPLLLITKTARDDYEIIRRYGLTETDFQEYTYEEDVDRVLFEGGLYVLKVHTGFQLQPQYIGVIDHLINYIRQKNYWVTSFDELQKWWLRKHGVELRYKTRSKRRIAVEVTNPTDETVYNFTVQLNINKRIKNIEVSSDIINTKIPKYEFDSSTNRLYLYLEKMEPHESRSFLVDFDNVPDSDQVQPVETAERVIQR